MSETARDRGFTLAIIKPDAVRQGGRCIGDIIQCAATVAGLHPIEIQMGEVSAETWQEFYAEHKGKPFWDELIRFMTSGPSIFMVLDGANAIAKWRSLMGATSPTDALPGTLRRKWGSSGPANAVHGSDSDESFDREYALLFRGAIKGPR